MLYRQCLRAVSLGHHRERPWIAPRRAARRDTPPRFCKRPSDEQIQHRGRLFDPERKRAVEKHTSNEPRKQRPRISVN